MASGTKQKKHKCSCGRSFRHAISLKRHQNVTGCKPLEDAPTLEASSEVESSDAKIEAAASAPVEVEDSRTIVITPELVASWQEQTGFQTRSSVIDQIPPRRKMPEIDWVAVGKTGKEFCEFLGEVKTGTVKVGKSALSFIARTALFLSVLSFSAWMLVSSVSAKDATQAVDSDSRSQLAAQHVVADFLQNARLNQYDRARRLLAPTARQSVTVDQLQVMMNSLPLNHAPNHWKTELSTDRQEARVILARDGLKETYTLVHSDTGWGLTSVSVANS